MLRRLFDPRVPFDPARLPFFYGWVIVGASTLGFMASIPGQTMGVSVFTDHLIEATGLSRLTLSQTYLAGTVMSGLSLPRVGRAVDRFGVRPVGLAAAAGLAAVLFFLSQLDRLFGAQLLRGGALVLGFFVLRLAGQGTLPLVGRAMTGKWFRLKRGLASGISGIFVAFAFGIAPRALDAWIARAGWRGALQEIGVVVGLGVAALVWLLYRDAPEEVGLEPDGGIGSTEGAPLPPEASATREEAIRTLAFWSVVLSLAFQALAITAVTFNVVDLGARAGLDREATLAVFLPSSVISTTLGFVFGWLADRVPVRLLILAMLAGQAGLLFAFTDLGSYFWLAVVAMGVGGGAFPAVSAVALPRFFGRTHLGAIAGLESMALVLGSACGPVLLAAVERQTGSYVPALQGLLVLPLAGVGLALLYRVPELEAPDPG